MNLRAAVLAFCCLVLFSCADDERSANQARDAKKKEAVFSKISAKWIFSTEPMNPASQELVANWDAWRDFLRELSQKPQSSLGAFQKKAKALSEKAAVLPTQIPSAYNKPEVRSRISVLVTKVNSLNLYLNLDEIPADKVSEVIAETNTELVSLQQQFGEIVRKAQIPKEQGESDMIRMLDTARAIPNDPSMFGTEPPKPSGVTPPVIQPKPATSAKPTTTLSARPLMKRPRAFTKAEMEKAKKSQR